VLDDQLADEVRITVIAAGFDQYEDEGQRSHAGDRRAQPAAPRQYDDAFDNGSSNEGDTYGDDSDVPDFLR
jgi:cell division GTPase FtsZ